MKEKPRPVICSNCYRPMTLKDNKWLCEHCGKVHVLPSRANWLRSAERRWSDSDE